MKQQTDTIAQGKAPAGTCSNAGTRSSPSNPPVLQPRSDAANATTPPGSDAKALTARVKWEFHVGIHRGTITSRDSEPPKDAESLEQCQEWAREALLGYASLGCHIWYCYAMSPSGERTTLIEGVDYR